MSSITFCGCMAPQLHILMLMWRVTASVNSLLHWWWEGEVSYWLHGSLLLNVFSCCCVFLETRLLIDLSHYFVMSPDIWINRAIPTSSSSSSSFLLNQWCTPPLRFQVSHCSTCLIMCDVPSTAVFVHSLLNAFLILFPYILLILLFQFCIWNSTFAEFLYLHVYILISFQSPFVLNFCPLLLPYLSICIFYLCCF